MKFLLSIFAFFGLSFAASAQMNPTKWTYTAEKTKTKGEYKIVMQADLQDKWAIYTQFLESQDGPVATAIAFDKSVQLVGKATEESAHKSTGYDDVFAMNLTKYKKQVKFVQTIKGKKGAKVKGTITYMTCDDASCLPPRDVTFEVTLK
jgi:thiol:disulfide interchange protein DsbD